MTSRNIGNVDRVAPGADAFGLSAAPVMLHDGDPPHHVLAELGQCGADLPYDGPPDLSSFVVSDFDASPRGRRYAWTIAPGVTYEDRTVDGEGYGVLTIRRAPTDPPQWPSNIVDRSVVNYETLFGEPDTSHDATSADLPPSVIAEAGRKHAEVDHYSTACPACVAEPSAEPEAPGYWLAYYPDWSGFCVFAGEVDALRWAVEHHAECERVPYGEDPRAHVNALHKARLEESRAKRDAEARP